MFDLFQLRRGLYILGIALYDMALTVALPLAGLETENFNSFRHIIDIAGLSQSQTSPSPSVSSESSGIGSLGSLKSESVNNDSLPSSPQTTEKKLFEPVVQPQPRPTEKKSNDVKVIYGGHDILNLNANLTDPRWNYRATVLPPNNPALFFANRSQYHRLGPFGTRTQYIPQSLDKINDVKTKRLLLVYSKLDFDEVASIYSQAWVMTEHIAWISECSLVILCLTIIIFA